MPIVDIRPVVSSSTALSDGAVQLLADSLGRVLSAKAGTVWVRVTELPEAMYAENGVRIAEDELPVFVEVLYADWPEIEARATEAESLAQVIADCLGRREGRVHIEYVPPGRGRVAFGGKLLI